MLKNFLTQKSAGIVSPLGETMPKYINTFDDDKLFIYKYQKYFNQYSFEMTISPKSSPLLFKEDCGACGANSILELHHQQEYIMNLLEEIVIKFKINILGTLELYKDKVHLHTHAIVNNMKESKLKRLQSYIKQFYSLDNKYIVNITKIRNYTKYKEYLIKDSYEYYSYHEIEKHDQDITLHSEILEKELELAKQRLHNIYNDPIKLHLHECIFNECPICNWIKSRGSNVKQAKGSLDAK